MPITAHLVWDGAAVQVPSEMGQPLPNQLQGTILEQLGEVSCRICYDSLGSGRSSANLHEHILQVKHTSVYEHPTITVEFRDAFDKYWRIFANRPGIWLELKANNLQVTYNLRTILEWDQHTSYTNTDALSNNVRHVLRKYALGVAPQVLKPEPHEFDITPATPLKYHEVELFNQSSHRLVPLDELTEHQAWISLYLCGSRGFSHEQVRHGNETAISQRSTRYVDESTSPYIEHPLITQFLQAADPGDRENTELYIRSATDSARSTYRYLVDRLQAFITAKGIDKLTARKQARGAARGYLGNALQTEMIFSASVAQWQWILKQRCSAPADAEIRVLYNQVLPVLQSSRYAKYFTQYSLADSPDGIGKVLV